MNIVSHILKSRTPISLERATVIAQKRKWWKRSLETVPLTERCKLLEFSRFIRRVSSLPLVSKIFTLSMVKL
jgi:hypothetical protein